MDLHLDAAGRVILKDGGGVLDGDHSHHHPLHPLPVKQLWPAQHEASICLKPKCLRRILEYVMELCILSTIPVEGGELHDPEPDGQVLYHRHVVLLHLKLRLVVVHVDHVDLQAGSGSLQLAVLLSGSQFEGELVPVQGLQVKSLGEEDLCSIRINSEVLHVIPCCDGVLEWSPELDVLVRRPDRRLEGKRSKRSSNARQRLFDGCSVNRIGESRWKIVNVTDSYNQGGGGGEGWNSSVLLIILSYRVFKKYKLSKIRGPLLNTYLGEYGHIEESIPGFKIKWFAKDDNGLLASCF